MKTRTLLLLSVATALLILLAGGALLFQLSNQENTTEPTPIGEAADVGDATITVFGSVDDGGLLRVEVEVSGVDDADGIDGFKLLTGDRRLDAIGAPAAGRCQAITVEAVRCGVDFDVSAAEGSSRVLVVRRGEDQATWRL